ncbi:hypothetical protein OAD26_00460 [bacterium]|nr:hypothetical protein [bacterium]
MSRTYQLRTAGKITVYTSLVGVLVFAFVFIFNLGATEIKEADAQSKASTTVTVLNTPPEWTVDAEELGGSSVTTPTNAGDTVSWTAVATDANAEDYYLLICSTSNAASATSGGAPTCNGGVQWAVSGTTTSGTASVAATTTADGWAESNIWYAFVCDGNAGTPRCSATSTQGSGTTSSPFEVNHRPTFDVDTFVNDGAADPGAVVTFSSTSDDPDISGVNDTVRLFVCSTNSFNTVTDECDALTLASTTVPGPETDAGATYQLNAVIQDQDYDAFGFVIDNHGFESVGGATGQNATITVNNVAPTISAATVSLVQATTTDMELTVATGETTGFTLEFITSDNNSCDAVGGTLGDEVDDFELSIYRSGVAACDVDDPNHYDPNDCYTSAVAASTWNLTCTASTTTCGGTSDPTMEWDCTFPLWYVADPTDGTATSTQYSAENWLAKVKPIDDDLASTSPTVASAGVEVTSFLAFSLNTPTIPYGQIAPGDQTDPLPATTTLAATGNVGLDTNVEGESMCTTYTTGNPCPNSSSSTIPAREQVFATSSVAYADATALSSTTIQEIEINVPKSTATTSQATNDAYWGIRVPASVTFAGDYTGENTFYAKVGEQVDW